MMLRVGQSPGTGRNRKRLAGGFNVTLPVTRADAGKVTVIKAARTKGTGVRRIARDLGVGFGTVLRVIGEGAVRNTAQPAHWASLTIARSLPVLKGCRLNGVSPSDNESGLWSAPSKGRH
jgi:hypothetical protein